MKGGALDVFDEEPLPAGHPFYSLENVLLSTHCADHTSEWLDNAMRFFIAQLERFRRGETLLNIVNKTLDTDRPGRTQNERGLAVGLDTLTAAQQRRRNPTTSSSMLAIRRGSGRPGCEA
jgi:hypothetical protein